MQISTTMTFTWIPMIQQRSPALKIVYTVIWDGKLNKPILSGQLPVNELVTVRFQWATSSSEDGEILTCSFSLKKNKTSDIHEDGYGTVIKMDLISSELKYSQQGICPPESWSDWQSITKVIDHPIKGSNTYVAKCDFYITAYKITINRLSSKLYADTDFTDFYLTTGDDDEGSVAVHKACLASHSEVFKAMLCGEWQEVKEGKIQLKGVTLQTLQHLKYYLYLGKLPDEGLRPLLLVARCYLMEDLVEHCIRLLAQTATSADLYSLHEFACENNIPELTFATLKLTQNGAVSAAHEIRQTEKLNSTQSM